MKELVYKLLTILEDHAPSIHIAEWAWNKKWTLGIAKPGIDFDDDFDPTDLYDCEDYYIPDDDSETQWLKTHSMDEGCEPEWSMEDDTSDYMDYHYQDDDSETQHLMDDNNPFAYHYTCDGIVEPD